MGLFHRHKKEEQVCIVDIGSASVGVALATLNTDDIPMVEVLSRQPIRLRADADGFGALSRGMFEALECAARELVESKVFIAGSRPRRAFVTFASPWYVSQTKNVTYSGKEPFAVSPKVVATALASEREKFSRTLFDRKKVNPKDIGEIIDSSVIEVKLNGYPVEDVGEQKVQAMDLRIFFSAVSRDVCSRVAAILEECLGVRHYEAHSFPLVAFGVTRGILATEELFAVLDVTGEVTDASIIKGDVLEETVSFPIGKDSIIRAVAERFNVSAPQALSLLHLYGEEKAEREAETRITECISTVFTSAAGVGEKICHELWSTRTLPQEVFIVADAELLSWVAHYRAVSSVPLPKINGYTFLFHVLGEKLLAAFVEYARGTKRDAFLSLETIFAGSLHVQGQENPHKHR